MTPEERKQRKAERMRKWRAKHPEENLERARKWREANREKVLEANKRWREEKGKSYYAENVVRIRENQKRYRLNNPDKVKQHLDSWRAANPEKAKASTKRWAEANVDRRRAATQRWAARNPEKLAQYKKEWDWRNPGRRRLYHLTVQDRKRVQAGVLSVDIVQILWELQQGMCAYDFWCRNDLAEIGFHLDHVMPLALGGRHEDANLQLLCPSCNLSKGPKHPDEFVRILRGRLADLGL